MSNKETGRAECADAVDGEGDDGPSAAVSRGTYGDRRINPDALGNDYEEIDADGNVKAKVWESDDGDRRLYLRLRDHDDGRKFTEYSVDLDSGGDE